MYSSYEKLLSFLKNYTKNKYAFPLNNLAVFFFKATLRKYV